MSVPGCKWIQENIEIKDIQQNNINVSLAFDKFIIWESYNFTVPAEKSDDRLKKKEHFKRIANIKPAIDNHYYIQLKNRKKSLQHTISFTLKTKTRLIVNHGEESILDNSIAIHPYYGFPIIPASAIKGVTRHFCKEFKDIGDAKILKIFGGEAEEKESFEGYIIFFDAWPLTISNLFEVDIFTPHYQEYYQEGNVLPADNQKLNPIPFLAVKKDIEFEFYIAPSSSCKDKQNELLSETKQLIIEALSTFGIGAKTGSNYGYFY